MALYAQNCLTIY